MASIFTFVIALVFSWCVRGDLECTRSVNHGYSPRLSFPSDSVHLLVSQSADEAGNTAICHVFCITYALEVTDVGSGSWNVDDNSATDTNSSTLGKIVSCNQLKKYLDCRSGCIAKSMNLTNCVETCSGRCQEVCGSDEECGISDNIPCGISCDEEDCRKGCQQFSQISSDVSQQPTEPPVLIRGKNPAIYSIHVPSDVQLYNNSSFMFRIETQPRDYVYQWNAHVIFDDITEVMIMENFLNLSVYAGLSINVSYSYVTKDGILAFSEPTEIRIFSEVVPLSPSDTRHALVTASQEEAHITSLCHVVCVHYAFQNRSPQDANETDSFPDLNTPSDFQSLFQGMFTCIQFQKYVDCRTGCISQCLSVEDNSCSGRCQGICKSHLGCHSFTGNLCGAGCNDDDCDAGSQQCAQFSSGELLGLTAPMNPPELVRMPQNMYNVVIPMDSEFELFAVSSPVFRIETETGQYYYQWIIDVIFEDADLTVTISEYLLDLYAYTGQKLNIAYAIATDMGISEYSQHTVVQVPDQCVVLALTEDQVTLAYDRDERAGFFTHYVLNVSWCLSSCMEGVSHYVITRHPEDGGCGENVTEIVNASTSTVLLKSNTTGTMPLPCTQIVQIETVLTDGTDETIQKEMYFYQRNVLLPKVTAGKSFPDLRIVGCPLVYSHQNQSYVVTLQFIAPFSPATLSHIKRFGVRVDRLMRLDDGRNDDTVITVAPTQYIPANADNTFYNYTTHLEPFQDTNQFYRLVVDVLWRIPRGPSRVASCDTIDAVAPPPFPIQIINITSIYTFDRVKVSPEAYSVTVSVSVKWNKPEVQYSSADIMGYELYLGERPLGPMEAGSQRMPIMGNRQNGTITQIFQQIPVSNQTAIAYLQIRSHQYQNIPSNWSEALEIEVINLNQPTPTLSSEPVEPSTSEPDSSTLTIALATASVLIAAIVIFITVALIYVYFCRQRYKIIGDKIGDAKTTEMSDFSLPGDGKSMIHDEWEISIDDIIVEELLGVGMFGEVYKGHIRGQLRNPKVHAMLRQAIGAPVAIKLLKPPSTSIDKANFLAEIGMMKKIAEGHNAHIVNMIGCVTLQEPLCLITEFVPYGDLLSYLKYQRKKQLKVQKSDMLQQQLTDNDTSESDVEVDEEAPDDDDVIYYNELDDIEPNDLIRFAYQIASGMEYLASLNIIHRDLACRNVLMAKDKLIKITDFGLSREVQEVYVKKTHGRLPLKWMAIESIRVREFTTASDVWAFGVTLYEIGTIGGFPYPSINNEDLLEKLSQGYRLDKPDNCSAEVYDVMLHCWQEDPKDRPSFSQLHLTFSDMLQATSGNVYIDLQVNEDAPYYQISDDAERRHSASSLCSEGSKGSFKTGIATLEQDRESLCSLYINQSYTAAQTAQTLSAPVDEGRLPHDSQTAISSIATKYDCI